jgi:hypothetical protein
MFLSPDTSEIATQTCGDIWSTVVSRPARYLSDALSAILYTSFVLMLIY